MNAWYAPGEQAAVVGRSVVVMTSGEHAEALAALVDRPVAPLDVVSSLSAGDVAQLPDFAAVVATGDDLVVMVRGSYDVSHGDREWSGAGAATWLEHRVAAAVGDEVVVRATGGASDRRLPIHTGVVLANRLTWRPAMSEGPAPVAVPPEMETVTGPPQRKAPTTDHVADTAPPGDHDGRTVSAAEVRRRSQQPADASASQFSATLAMSGGETVDLTRPVIIGRSPRTGQVSSTELPHLIVVEDPYVSGTQLEVARHGDSVVAIDRSTNGTLLTRPGRKPVRLPKNEPTVVTDGCVLRISEDITATIAIEGVDR